MQTDLKNVVENTRQLYLSKSALNMLLDFERVLDEMDIYAFDNWKIGELVSGPEIGKYRVSCIFMWPLTKMPDPAGAERLLAYGAKTRWTKTWLSYPIKVHDPSDYRDSSKKPKLKKTPIWLVEIEMPKDLLRDVAKGSVEIMDQKINLDDLEGAYEQDFDQQGTVDKGNANATVPIG